MKFIPYPDIDDENILTAIAANMNLTSHPALSRRLGLVLSQYATYVKVKGNPHTAGAPQPLGLSAALRRALIAHYDSPPAILNYLTDVRDKGSPDVCPMCGSPKTGTLDHIFPKTAFSEFAFFSKNLVPACDCNNKRGSAFMGRVGERVLHPYFDRQMGQRLIRARISPVSGSYKTPLIELIVCIRRSDPIFKAVSYHLERIILRTNVFHHLENLWPKLFRFYDHYFKLPEGKSTKRTFDRAVSSALQLQDNLHATPNNWNSMLLAGLSRSFQAKSFLTQHIRDVRSGRKRLEDI